METSDYIQFSILIVTLLAVMCSCWAIWQTKSIANQQFKLHFFAEYTKRYQELMLYMPKDIDTSSIHNKDVDVYMRLYFDLCSEEFLLHSKGVIDDYVWSLWVEGMRTLMNKTKYKTAWKLLGSYYDNKSFVNFMNDLNRDKE